MELLHSHPKSIWVFFTLRSFIKRCQFFPPVVPFLRGVSWGIRLYLLVNDCVCRLPIPRPGEVLGLVGTNGIGKSTALKILAGKQKPNLGKYDVSAAAASRPRVWFAFPFSRL